MTRGDEARCGSVLVAHLQVAALVVAVAPIAIAAGLWLALRRPEARPGDDGAGWPT